MHKMRRALFLAYPLAVASLDLTEYDLVISSSSGYAKGVRTSHTAAHLCYCHTPTRWIWRYHDYAKRENFGPAQRLVLPALLKAMRSWDEHAARQPDQFIANSQVVAERIWDVYKRKAVIIHPPIDVNRFRVSSEHDGHYLVLSRLVSYKRIDLAIEACNLLKRRLVIIGDGPDRERLERLAGATVTFLGWLPDRAVEQEITQCRALIFPGEEDFGMTPLELAAAGKPTIAFRAGGALETVLPGITGVLFPEQTAQSLAYAIEELEARSWNAAALRKHATKFDGNAFRAQFQKLLHSIGIRVTLRTTHDERNGVCEMAC